MGGDCDVHGQIQSYDRSKGQAEHSLKVPCLFVYANDDWKVFEQKLASLPLINEEARQFARFFLSGAQYVTVDKQGRILMPQDLREFAGLEKDVVLAGTGGRIEIWSLEKWDANSSQVDINKISQGMVSLGLTI